MEIFESFLSIVRTTKQYLLVSRQIACLEVLFSTKLLIKTIGRSNTWRDTLKSPLPLVLVKNVQSSNYSAYSYSSYGFVISTKDVLSQTILAYPKFICL